MGMMIIVAPLFWFSFMGSMGIAVGNFVTVAFNSLNGESQMAASKGAAATKSVSKAAASVITKL
jgi:hypothetical protein